MNIEQRQHWMSVLARAPSQALENYWAGFEPKPEITHLRAPEVGMVMVQARSGGTGDVFNMGEATMSRCTVRLNEHQTGFGYVKGRSKRHAELAAIFDALLQDTEYHRELMENLIQVQLQNWCNAREEHSCEVAATQVNFFTLVRGE